MMLQTALDGRLAPKLHNLKYFWGIGVVVININANYGLSNQFIDTMLRKKIYWIG